MREIKFRCWDTAKKQPMIFFGSKFELDDYHDTISFETEKDSFVMGDSDEKGDRFILMQYTGLTDCNGVYIYDGDIIKHRKYTNQHSDYSYNETPKQVKWNEKNACFEFGTGIFTASPKYLKVIGNIYENPELLTNETTQ